MIRWLKPGFMEITFVACVHFDPRGYSKLLNLIERKKPSHIFVELSPWGLYFRKRYRTFLLKRLHNNLKRAAHVLCVSYSDALKHPSIQSIIAQISIPYEYRAPHTYCRKKYKTVTLVDSSLFSIRYTSKWQQLIEEENLILLLKQNRASLNSQVAFEYRQARDAYTRKSNGKQRKGTLLDQMTDLEKEREGWLINQLRLQLGIWKPDKSLYVGGWKHLLPETYFMRQVTKIQGLISKTAILSHPPYYLKTASN